MRPGIKVAHQTEPDAQIGVLTYPIQLRKKGWRQGMKILVTCSHKLVGQSLSLILGDLAEDIPVECEVIDVEYAIVRARLAARPDCRRGDHRFPAGDRHHAAPSRAGS